MEITPLGDSALLVRVAENFDDASEAVLNKVLATKRNLEAAKIPGVIEVAPAYTTVAFFYNPVGAVDAGAPVENVAGWIEQRIRQALAAYENAYSSMNLDALQRVWVLTPNDARSIRSMFDAVREYRAQVHQWELDRYMESF